jgi:antitoxin CptB
VIAATPLDGAIGLRELSKLKWRCRRGLLENDLFIERFFQRYERTLTQRQAQALSELMTLSDNDLLDLHLARKSLCQLDASGAKLARQEVQDVLDMLRQPAQR